MKKHWTCVRGSEAGHHTIGIPFSRFLHHKACNARCWVACLGAVLLVLLLAQGWLILHSTSATRLTSATISPINPYLSTEASSPVDTGHLALLDTLWAALPFTHVIKHHEGSSTSSFWNHTTAARPSPNLKQQLQQQQQPQPAMSTGGAMGAGWDDQPDSTSSTTSSSSSNGAAAAKLPVLRTPSHPEVGLLQRLTAAVLRSGLTASEAREAFVAAFQTVAPPRGFPAWQVKVPPTPEAAAAAEAASQQQQHKGAQYIYLDESDSDAAVNVTAADFLKGRPKARTLDDEAAVAAAAAAATAYLARSTAARSAGQYKQQQDQQDQQHSGTAAGMEAAELLMRYALLLIKASHKVAPCAVDDASLPIDKLMGGPAAPKVLLSVTEAAGGPQALPNMVLQLLQFVMQTHPGSLYISLVDSSNNSSSRISGHESALWMDVLQLLLTPLDVPLLVVQQQEQHGTDAAARNAAIEPFFDAAGFSSCSLYEPALAQKAPTGTSTSAGAALGSGSSSSAGQPLAFEHSADSGAVGGADPADSPWHVAGAAGPEIQTAAAQDEGADGAISSSSSASWASALWQAHSVGRSLLSRGSFVSSFVPAGRLEASGELKKTAQNADTRTAAASSSMQVDPVAAAIAAAFIQPEPQLSSQSAPPRHRPECFTPDLVLFIQASSFFCKSDLQRLLIQTDSDMSCGMDLHVAEPSPNPAGASAEANASTQATPAAVAVETITRHLMRQHPAQQQQAQPQRGGIAALDWKIKHRRQLLTQQQAQPSNGAQSVQELGAAAASVADVWFEQPPALDIWKHPVVYASASVGRMVNGLPFTAAPYYAGGHAPTLRRLVAGLPVQVHCCWGGLTRLTAEPLRRGLRFREHAMQGECSSAGHNLLCDDLHRTGFNKVLLDAGVLLTHDLDVSVKFTQLIKAADRAPFIRRSRWVEVQGAGSPWELDSHALQQSFKWVQCCRHPSRLQQQQSNAHDLLIVDEMVQAAAASSRPGGPLPLKGWDAWGCRAVDILSSNYTANFLQSIGVDVT